MCTIREYRLSSGLTIDQLWQVLVDLWRASIFAAYNTMALKEECSNKICVQIYEPRFEQIRIVGIVAFAIRHEAALVPLTHTTRINTRTKFIGVQCKHSHSHKIHERLESEDLLSKDLTASGADFCRGLLAQDPPSALSAGAH